MTRPSPKRQAEREATMGEVIALRTKAQRTTKTRVDTIAFTLAELESWKKPKFQREIKFTKKMDEVVEDIRASGGVFPGIITLGVLDGTNDIYKIDGHHRCEAFKKSGCGTGYADVRWLYGSMEDFAEEYKLLNGCISRQHADDLLRADAIGNPKIERLRSECRVIAFAPRKTGKVSVSMSMVLRSWANARRGTPAARGKAASGIDIIQQIEDVELAHLTRFINLCESAWGRDQEYAQLWNQMNLTMCMWLYNRLVVEKPAPMSRLKQLTTALFEKCLMSLSADSKYVEWLRGRNGAVHRSPCYTRVKEHFAARLKEETGVKHNLPQPDWAANPS
jgi:hypothetical protein